MTDCAWAVLPEPLTLAEPVALLVCPCEVLAVPDTDAPVLAAPVVDCACEVDAVLLTLAVAVAVALVACDVLAVEDTDAVALAVAVCAWAVLPVLDTLAAAAADVL